MALQYITTLVLSTGKNITPFHRQFFEDADVISTRKVSFVYDKDGNFYHPTEGDYKVLGHTVPIKEYTWEEFKTLIGDEPVTLEISKRVNGEDAFDCEELETVVDYREVVTELHRTGAIQVRPTTSWMATDDRAFSFGDVDEDGEEVWWDVDLLGTTFGQGQTERLLHMWEA